MPDQFERNPLKWPEARLQEQVNLQVTLRATTRTDGAPAPPRREAGRL
jgi:hypothetical protein